LKSIFRYPGAKSSKRARQAIQKAFPSEYTELRECFVGGGSTFFSTPPTIRRWINDLNRPLIAVYEALKGRPKQFIDSCRQLASDDPAILRSHFQRLLWDDRADEAVRYFFLNRCGYNGRVRLDAWRHRTFFSNPAGIKIVHGDRLVEAANLLNDVTVTCSDFEWLFDEPGDGVVVFADPPYVRDTELTESAKLYEKGFTIEDHHRLKRCIDRCKHKVVLTYDDNPLIRRLYREFYLTEASWTYRGNDKRIVGRDLVITNFPTELEPSSAEQMEAESADVEVPISEKPASSSEAAQFYQRAVYPLGREKTPDDI
jgi:DNA adenine methylase